MDMNAYALEVMVDERLRQARQAAAAYALAARARRPPRPFRVSLGLLLIGLGRWLRWGRGARRTPPTRGAGLGTLVLRELIRRARELGGHSMLARITSGNAASLRLHQKHGFSVVGVEREVAFKLGRWHDVTVLQHRL